MAAVVLTQVRSGYLGRVLVVTAMGLFGFVSILVSYWNWYGFPTDFTIGAVLDEVIGWFLGRPRTGGNRSSRQDPEGRSP